MKSPAIELGDFTANARTLTISAIAVAIGALSSVVALGLLSLIRLFTNLFFFQTLDTVNRLPSDHHLGLTVIAVPVIGALVIGLMARYGSERIRGHGIPEAIEAILLNGSRVEPKLAILKPLSSAISIGSGGPFGAEGPIIMTGGAFGSLTAQLLHLTASERKTLLVAGAAGGMSATFGAPLASVLLAFELLLFEWKPRSLIPVALSSATAAILRHYLMGPTPLFPASPHAAFIGPVGFLFCAVSGLIAGCLSGGLTASVYFFEDLFLKIKRIHWMWWPAFGGLAIGIGGAIFPEALGVGFDMIGQMIQGDVTSRVLVGILLVKWTIWAIALGSGTSGGVLAPLLMIGGALGGIEAMIFPGYGPGFWPMISMAATLAGTMRSPLTAIVFALELTHEFNMMFPLMIGVFVAYGFTVLALKRSILTEKLSRRGFHLSREYAIDPLETIFVKAVMRTNIVALSPETTASDLAAALHHPDRNGQRLFPIVDAARNFVGVITHREALKLASTQNASPLANGMNRNPLTVSPHEPLRSAVNLMAEAGVTRLPVVDPAHPRSLIGMISIRDLLHARARNLAEERNRERVLRLRFPRLEKNTS